MSDSSPGSPETRSPREEGAGTPTNGTNHHTVVCWCKGHLPWVAGLLESYGWKLLVTIFCTHHLLKGFVGGGGSAGLVGAAMEYTYRGYGVSGPNLQVYTSVALLPWSTKALMGITSDGFPLGGYRKAPYIILATVLALVAYSLLGLRLERGGAVASSDITEDEPEVADVQGSPPLPLVTCGFVVAFLQMALCDLLVEAKYSEKVKADPSRGPDLITFVWGGISLAGLLSTGAAGTLIKRLGPASCYLVAAPFAGAVLWPAAHNYLEEVRTPGCCRPDLQKISGAGRVPFILALVMGLAGFFLAVFSISVQAVWPKFVAAVSVGLLNLALFSVFLRPAIARVNAFFFVQSAFHVGTHGASFYFFTDNDRQYPAGPHFSPEFFVTAIGSVASLCSFVGMLCYNAFGKRLKYRTVLVGSSVLFSTVNCLSVVVYARLNIRLGIDDKFFMVASSAMQSAIGQLSWMPMTVMLAQLVPDGLESTMYALLAGSLNLGTAVANYAGAFVLNSLGVTPRGEDAESAKFDKLWLAALLSALAPCVPLLLVSVLIPDARQTDRLLNDDGGSCSATAGSLFERWRCRWQGPGYEVIAAPHKANRSPHGGEMELQLEGIGKSA